ncbi:hypothetical protein E3N88_24068 [Mikania micrantha]|uniref:Uncharacterized protein n=1 Tax=Mikania micrantha TaxID=192012 RepID=A0A5N6LHJ3_9ASTR|nr:hypothetical protein E3N88_43308 [Mikania micrantha]KAD4586467.1 hypothetical protein E3N88_24068 [Mikania micrantha]
MKIGESVSKASESNVEGGVEFGKVCGQVGGGGIKPFKEGFHNFIWVEEVSFFGIMGRSKTRASNDGSFNEAEFDGSFGGSK